MSIICESISFYENADISNIFDNILSYVDVASDFMYYFSIVENDNVLLWQKNAVLAFAILGACLDFFKCIFMFYAFGEYLDGNTGLANALFTKNRSIFSLLIIVLEDIPQIIIQTMIELNFKKLTFFYIFSISFSLFKSILLIAKSLYVYLSIRRFGIGRSRTIRCGRFTLLHVERMPRNNHTSELSGVTYFNETYDLCGCTYTNSSSENASF